MGNWEHCELIGTYLFLCSLRLCGFRYRVIPRQIDRELVLLYTLPHGSLEGVGELKTSEAYHSKADALVIPEMYFLKIYLRPFLEMLIL